jgi:insertion element IS1 protein InsB
MSVAVTVPEHKSYGIHFLRFTAKYEEVFPSKRHKAVGKETGKTNHIERFNNTLRQRISRLVRKTLSFSKNSKIILEPFGILFTTITTS